MIFDITVRYENRESFRIESDKIEDAETQALEQCIAKHPGCDVWLDGTERITD